MANIWSDKEKEIVMEYYLTEGIEGVQKRGVNRSELSIKRVYIALNKAVSTTDRHWTLEEEKILRDYLVTEGIKGIKARGITKSVSKIYKKAIKMGLF